MGVDACKRGWIGVRLTGDRLDVLFAPGIGELVGQASRQGPLAVMAIDIPIGLPDSGVRKADLLARPIVGQRSASVFLTPVRRALAEEDYARAVIINKELSDGRAFSRQAFGLRTKILEVDTWLPDAGVRVAEIHPEVCFATMARGPLAHSKKTWAGVELRRRLLAQVGISLPSELGEAGGYAAVDDVLDAAAAAWAATRVLNGTARSLPESPEVFSDGLPCAIWY